MAELAATRLPLADLFREEVQLRLVLRYRAPGRQAAIARLAAVTAAIGQGGAR